MFIQNQIRNQIRNQNQNIFIKYIDSHRFPQIPTDSHRIPQNPKTEPENRTRKTQIWNPKLQK